MEKQKAVRLCIYILIGLLLVYLLMVITGKNGLMALQKKHGRLKSLLKKNERLEQKNVDLYRVINRIKNDPAYVEDIARRELKMIGKDEIVYKFMDHAKHEKGDADKTGKLKNGRHKKTGAGKNDFGKK